jgi:NAD-specific glutamate dehydrogenase
MVTDLKKLMYLIEKESIELACFSRSQQETKHSNRLTRPATELGLNVQEVGECEREKELEYLIHQFLTWLGDPDSVLVGMEKVPVGGANWAVSNITS